MFSEDDQNGKNITQKENLREEKESKMPDPVEVIEPIMEEEIIVKEEILENNPIFVEKTLPRWKKPFQKKVQPEMMEEELVEDISQEELLDTDVIEEEIIDETITPESEDILMTKETVDQIEQQSKSKIEWEKFKSDLDYLKKKQKRDEYESKLIEGLANDPEHIDILEHLADFYMMDNQPKKALPLYKKIVEQQSENHVFLRKMAQVYLLMKDFEMAEVLLDNALAIHPETPKYAMNLVEIYYKTGRKKNSLSVMEDIVKRRPENMSYRNALVNLYEEFGYNEQIVDAYESMLLLDPTNVALKRKLLEARTQMN